MAQDFVPIQQAAKEYGVSVTGLYKYIRTGKLRRYRQGFDRLTYLDRREIDEVRRISSLRTFTADVPVGGESPVLARLLRQLQLRAPNHHWERAGWGSASWVGGQRVRQYTVLKYVADDMRAVVPELSQALSLVDPSGDVDRYRIRLSEHPFE